MRTFRLIGAAVLMLMGVVLFLAEAEAYRRGLPFFEPTKLIGGIVFVVIGMAFFISTRRTPRG